MESSITLTYEELAERLGIGPESARIKAKRMERRGQCSIMRGNDGKARVTLSSELLPERPPERSGEQKGNAPRLLPELYGELLQALDELKEIRQHISEPNGRIHDRELEQEVSRLRIELAKVQAEKEAVKAVAIADVEAAKVVAEAEVATARAEAAAKDVLIGELRAELAQARRPWWRKLLG